MKDKVKMKTKLLIIIGIAIFLIGISIIAYVIYVDSDLNLTVKSILLLAFGLMVPGLVISGIGIVLESQIKMGLCY